MSQGYIGIDLQNAIKYELTKRGINKKVSTILSQIEVDPEDKAFENPSKPIGRFMSEAEAEDLRKKGIHVMSAATFSNLESKGGSRLNEIVQAVCSRFSLDPEVFSLDVQSFTAAMNNCASTNGELQELLKNGDKEGNVGQLVNRLTMYFADEIISGRLHRGDQIATDRELAKQLGVGRSAIREALKVLDILGMIDIRLGQGTYLVGQESNFFAVPLS